MSYFILSIVFLIGGILLRIIRQKSITGIGYKTRSSMKNLDTWNEANKYCANILILGNGVSVIIGANLLIKGYRNFVYCFWIIVISLVLACVFTEVHMTRVFNKDGSRK
ncbi:SdpI family protein [Clostridium sp. C8-1-8]|uniref:SdpI family protein n=1 Tax=Clostridium sp. C8-1-8 TaxID=2698831 RepID=UPI001369CA55|nr:SdpI family protein [Clostridium sp. C8-1-8]